MSSRSCPDWPTLLELAPELHFKHYTIAEARLAGEILVNLADVPREAVAICADLDHNVYYAAHTDPRISAALEDTYWYELNTWVRERPPG
ncbi:MAG TPA: hypothetical protein VGJ34_03905 [Gaiellaceae bacterium]|jgi:hypothetical protein